MSIDRLKVVRKQIQNLLDEVDEMLGNRPQRARASFNVDEDRLNALVSSMKSRMTLADAGCKNRSEVAALAQELRRLGWRKRQCRLTGRQRQHWFKPSDPMYAEQVR